MRRQVTVDVYDFINLFTTLIVENSWRQTDNNAYSTVTDLARLRGLSTSVPRAQAV